MTNTIYWRNLINKFLKNLAIKFFILFKYNFKIVKFLMLFLAQFLNKPIDFSDNINLYFKPIILLFLIMIYYNNKKENFKLKFNSGSILGFLLIQLK